MEPVAYDCIDAHHHLWNYSEEQYPWMSDKMQVLRQNYLPDDLQVVMQASGVDGTVAVQARQTLQETEWLLDLANQHPFIRGVVGWAPLIDPAVGQELEKFAAHPKMKAVRHVLHDEQDDFYMLREDFNRGIALLKNYGLRYDILIFERHLPQTITFVDKHPSQIFIVDHIAKPLIREGQISNWRENLMELSKRENVYCKLSGMVTEADWQTWTDASLSPYFEIVLQAFGPARLMFGSDWPVLNLASNYDQWVQTVKRAIRTLSATEQARIMGATAKDAYRL